MLNIYHVLYQKEQELKRVRREVEVLRTVLPLLVEEPDIESVRGVAGATVIRFQRGSWPGGREPSQTYLPD